MTTDDAVTRLHRAHRDVYTSLLELCESLLPEQWRLPTGCPGWTVRDVFAHVVGLEAVLAGDPEPEVDLPDLPHLGSRFARYVETHVEARRGAAVADLLLEAREVFSRRLGQVEAIVDLTVEVDSPFGRGPASRRLPIRVFDLWAHEQDIRRAVARPGHLEGPAPELARRCLEEGLAASLPARLDRPGAVVSFNVTGSSGREFGIDLGEGRLLVPPPRDPAVRLSMPFPDLVARGCGRDDAPAPELVLIEGDRQLADRILAAMAVTP